MDDAVAFFAKHAPAARHVSRLIEAERTVLHGPYVVLILPTPDDHDNDVPVTTPLWSVYLVHEGGGDDVIGAVHGIACESDASPAIRVVAAELAASYLLPSA